MTEPESKRFHFEQGEELLEELNNGEGVSPELSRTMSDELNQLRRHPDDVLIVGTEGTKSVTIFLAPFSVVQGDGPVLVPTFDAHRIVSMVSKEFIQGHADACGAAEDQDKAQSDWNDLMDKIFNGTVDLAEANEELTSWLTDRP